MKSLQRPAEGNTGENNAESGAIPCFSCFRPSRIIVLFHHKNAPTIEINIEEERTVVE